MPTAVPAADGPVVGLGSVLDAGGGPELLPRSRGRVLPAPVPGLPLEGWDWADHRGDFDDAGGVRFGSFAVTGALRRHHADVRVGGRPARSTTRCPGPSPTSSAAERPQRRPSSRRSREELQELPGALSTMPGDNLVVVDVVHDDGSLQDWADATYGAGLVFVHSALAPAAG